MKNYVKDFSSFINEQKLKNFMFNGQRLFTLYDFLRAYGIDKVHKSTFKPIHKHLNQNSLKKIYLITTSPTLHDVDDPNIGRINIHDHYKPSLRSKEFDGVRNDIMYNYNLGKLELFEETFKAVSIQGQNHEDYVNSLIFVNEKDVSKLIGRYNALRDMEIEDYTKQNPELPF